MQNENGITVTVKGCNFKIDEEDLPIFSAHTWCIRRSASKWLNYLITAKSRKDGGGTLLYHRLVMNANRGDIVDHINGDTLDNRKENLRLVNYRINAINRKMNKNNKTGYRGVTYVKEKHRNGIWKATIRTNGKQIYLGRFKSPIEASKKYDEAAAIYHGKYRREIAV